MTLRTDPPFPITEFPGSFVRMPQGSGLPHFGQAKTATFVAYFTYGWKSKEIWKSAVSLLEKEY
jgi:hypothetical protein